MARVQFYAIYEFKRGEWVYYEGPFHPKADAQRMIDKYKRDEPGTSFRVQKF